MPDNPRLAALDGEWTLQVIDAEPNFSSPRAILYRGTRISTQSLHYTKLRIIKAAN